MEFRRKYKGSASFLTAGSASSAPLADSVPTPVDHDSSFSDIDVLSTIQRLGTPSPQDVEEALSASEIVVAIESLLGEGFVEQDQGKLKLTPQGELALRYSRIAKA